MFDLHPSHFNIINIYIYKHVAVVMIIILYVFAVCVVILYYLSLYRDSIIVQ